MYMYNEINTTLSLVYYTIIDHINIFKHTNYKLRKEWWSKLSELFELKTDLYFCQLRTFTYPVDKYIKITHSLSITATCLKGFKFKQHVKGFEIKLAYLQNASEN